METKLAEIAFVLFIRMFKFALASAVCALTLMFIIAVLWRRHDRGPPSV